LQKKDVSRRIYIKDTIESKLSQRNSPLRYEIVDFGALTAALEPMGLGLLNETFGADGIVGRGILMLESNKPDPAND
jgi:hypothetical protein